MKFIWDNTCYTIEDSILKVEDDLSTGSKIGPILVELTMRKWRKKI
jgi:hypothetical protein